MELNSAQDVLYMLHLLETGAEGYITRKDYKEGMKKIDRWIEEHPDEWPFLGR